MESVPRAIATGLVRVANVRAELIANQVWLRKTIVRPFDPPESTLAGRFVIATRSVPGAIATGLQVSLLDRHEMLALVWNDTDIPLAYLITFRCYGTWLHGDKRGSIDRFHRRYKSPYIEPNQRWHGHNVQALEGQPVILDALQRKSVERAVRSTCQFRKWQLHALSVRTNHIHVVVCIGPLKPERALTAFKANSTKQMRQDGCWPQDSTPWAEKGSKRYLWNERSVAQAIEYVLYGQGDELPDFED